jgi:hypothetical protein
MSIDNENASAGPTIGGTRSVCRHLRSKGQFITGLVDPAAESDEVGDGHCWCSVTSHALGPDDDFAARASCVAGRSCFVALV